jgi:outer membrane protein assembly complex protein YaeT
VFLSPFCWVGISAFKRIERLDPRELRTDVARLRVFYFRRGYRDVAVDTTIVRDEGVVDVTFLIDEGAPVIVRSLEIAGLDSVPDVDEITEGVELEVGDNHSEVALATSRTSMEVALRNRGWAEAAILVDRVIPGQDSLLADVILRAELGPRSRIGDIRVVGSTAVEPDVIRRLLTFGPGDDYSYEEVLRSQRQLYSMALFDYVAITVDSVVAPSDSVIDIVVQVNEAEQRAVQVGAGVSTTECFQVEAGWSHRNFLGGTRKLELTGVLSNIGAAALAQTFPCSQAGVDIQDDVGTTNPYNKVNWRLRADFQQPWFLGTENWLLLGVFTERQSLPAIYARVSYGADVRFSRELSPGTAVIASWRPGRDSLEEGSADFLWCANFGICDPEDISTLSEPRWLSWIALTFAQSRTDAVLNPNRGYRLTLEGETASRFTGSEWAYYRAAGEVAWYNRLGGSNVLALRLRGGLVRPIGSGLEGVELSSSQNPVTHPLKRTYAGGAYTVRGYGQNLLGPKTLLADSSSLTNPGDPNACDPDLITSEGTWICDPTAAGLTSNQVFPRPIGGENVVVGNVEMRMPFAAGRWTSVFFMDVGKVWNTGGEISSAEGWAWSPGVGVRYASPVGPLRLDIGYATGGSENLPIVTLVDTDSRILMVQLVDENGNPQFFNYDPYKDSGLGDFFSRLQLHFSIGHAF